MRCAGVALGKKTYLDALAVGGTTGVDVATSGVTTDERDGANGRVVADEVDRVLDVVTAINALRSAVWWRDEARRGQERT
jgi:hypothetical protein